MNIKYKKIYIYSPKGFDKDSRSHEKASKKLREKVERALENITN